MSKSIMIVEDDQIFHDIYSEMLEDTDYRIISVYDGDDTVYPGACDIKGDGKYLYVRQVNRHPFI